MSAYLVSFVDGLIGTVGGAWPEVKANGIYQSTQSARTSLDKKSGASELPFAVIDLGIADEGTEWGLCNQVDDFRAIALQYVATDSVSEDQLVAKLEALRDYLNTHALTVGQRIGRARVSWQARELPFRAFALQTQRPFVCGGVILRAIVGETP